MIRAIKLTTYCTRKKQKKITSLVKSYRKAVNFYLRQFYLKLIKEPKLNKETLNTLAKTKLTERYKSNALKQALSIWKSYKKVIKKQVCKNPKQPKFRGFPILDAKFVTIETGRNSFDVWIRLSTLIKQKRIFLPSKKHRMLNYWTTQGKLIQGCELHPNKIIVWVEIEQQSYKEGKALGIDLGQRKLITTNEAQFIGKEMGEHLDNIARKKKGSKGFKRALRQRDIFINKCIKELPWADINVLCYEDLTGIKSGKKGFRKSKRFRRRQQHWTFRKVITRLIEECEENRVRPIYVNPKNTSRTCPFCGHVDAANRTNEDFCCLACGYKQDADVVGAMNVLHKGLAWLRSVESLNSKSYKRLCFN